MEGLVMRENFWRGRRVFVTGHTGFKGSWLCLWLQMRGAHVTGFALAAPTEPALFHAAEVGRDMVHVQGDVTDAAAVNRAMREAAPEIVFHLAAQSLVRASYQDPIATYAANVMGTVHVLEAARYVPGIRALVNVTSDKCYANREATRGYTESDSLGGDDPYSSSKGCAELITSAYRHSFFAGYRHGAETPLGIASARAGNVIGGGDWAVDRLLPDLLRAWDSGVPVTIRRPCSVRPWQHVLEPLAGYLTLAERLYDGAARYGGAWNFGPSVRDARRVEDVVSLMIAALGGGMAARVEADTRAPHEAGLLMLDATKARQALAWRSVLTLEEALVWIAEWHRAYKQGVSARALTLAQIERYEACLATVDKTVDKTADHLAHHAAEPLAEQSAVAAICSGSLT